MITRQFRRQLERIAAKEARPRYPIKAQRSEYHLGYHGEKARRRAIRKRYLAAQRILNMKPAA